jgi:cytochrome bd-type quinol oxidase subunit 2
MAKKSKTFTFISIISLIVAIVCIITFSLIKPTVDADGLVHEPFFLLPLFFIFLFISIITLIFALYVRAKAKKQEAKEKAED